MRLEEAVLLLVGIVGVVLGTAGLAARPDSIGIVLGLLVIVMGAGALWLGWLLRRDAPRRRVSGASHPHP